VRAGNLADRVTYFRNDLFDLIDPTIAEGGATGTYPHIFMVDFEDGPDGPATQVALGAQEEVAEFFAIGRREHRQSRTIKSPHPSGFVRSPNCGTLARGP
jgi:hypothetical protein